MKNSIIYYSVGALLYTSADNTKIADDIILEKFNTPYSLAFSFDTAASEEESDRLEGILIKTLDRIFVAKKDGNFYTPKLFIKVLSASHIPHLYKVFGTLLDLITGFILPGFCISTADIYLYEMQRINAALATPVYAVPELDGAALVDIRSRFDSCYAMKEKLDSYEDYILNIFVSVNPVLNTFRIRHSVNENIYQTGPVAALLSDIITVFSSSYVVSAPPFEYYSGIGWQEGLIKELNLDRLHGFVGKTVIHPKQIFAVNTAYKVTGIDYDDALSILDDKRIYQVSANVNDTRVNETKIHYNWAMQTVFLAKYFGVNKY